MYSGVAITTCEACREKGLHKGCTLLPGRIICERCLHLWYDEGIVNVAELGRRSLEVKYDPNHWLNNPVFK